MKSRIWLSILLSFLSAALVTKAWIIPAHADITGTRWVGPKYDSDDFLGGTNFVAFTEDTNATLLVTVYNNLASPLNVSAVKILIDWNLGMANYSSTQASQSSPLVIPQAFTYTFNIVFQVPELTTASNLFLHHYWVYVDMVNATSGPQEVTNHATDSGSDFRVYSQDQAEAQNTRMEYDKLIVGFMPVSQEAKIFLKNADMHYKMAQDSYEAGDFAGAKTHYQAALNMLDDALDAEDTYQISLQDNDLKSDELDLLWQEAQVKNYEAQTKYYEAQTSYQEAIANATLIEANATMRQADAQFAIAEAMKMQANAWVVFGLGFVVFGFAAVVWAYRRPIKKP